MERTIDKVFDVTNGETYYASDFFRKPEHELIHWRRALEEAILLGKPRLICPYCQQMLKICGRKDKRGIVSYFSHLYDSDDCEIKTTTQLSKEEIQAIKYGLVSESERHHQLKHLIADALSGAKSMQIGVSSVEIEKRINSMIPYLKWRRPDVQAELNGKKIVFELQLSTTFLSVIVDRDIFYRLNGYYIIWVFNFDDNKEYVNLHNMMCKDIYYANKRNIFIFNKRAQELSAERGELILCCQWLNANGEFTQEEYLSLEQLSFDSKTYKPYYVDADKLYYDTHPESKSNLEQLETSRREILQSIMEHHKLEMEYLKAKCLRINNVKTEIIDKLEKADIYEVDKNKGFIYQSQKLSEPIYSDIEWNDDYKMFHIQKARRCGLANRAGDIFIPCVCSRIVKLPNNLYLIVEKKIWRIWGSKSILKKELVSDQYTFEKLNYNYSLITFEYKERSGCYNTRKEFLIFPDSQTREIKNINKIDMTLEIDGKKYALHPDGYIFHNLIDDISITLSSDGFFGLKKAEKQMLPSKYSELNYISNECIFVLQEGNIGTLTLDNQTIVPLKFKHITPIDFGFYKTHIYKNHEYYNWNTSVHGLFDKKGNEIFSPAFDDIIPISSELFIIKEGKNYGLIDKHNVEKLPLKYSYLSPGNEGELIASCTDNPKEMYIIDYDGNIIFGKDLECETIVFQNGIYAFCKYNREYLKKSCIDVPWSILKNGEINSIPILATDIKYIFNDFLIIDQIHSTYCVNYENIPLTPSLYGIKTLSSTDFVAECELYRGEKCFINRSGILNNVEGEPTIKYEIINKEQTITEILFIGSYLSQNNHSKTKGVYLMTSGQGPKVIVPFKYDEIEFSNNYILCKYKVNYNTYYQVLYDINGQEIIPLFWHVKSIDFRTDNIIKLTVIKERNGYNQYYNVWLKSDFSLFVPWYNDISEIDIFFNGIAEAKRNNKKGKIDINGNFIKDIVEHLPNNLVKTLCFEEFGLDTEDGNEVIPCKYRTLELMPNGMFIGDNKDIISSNGVLINSTKGELTYLNQHLFILKDKSSYDCDNNLYLCDTLGNTIGRNYSAIYERSEYIYVEYKLNERNKWSDHQTILVGLYNQSGNLILNTEYNNIYIPYPNIVVFDSYIKNLNNGKIYSATKIQKLARIKNETYYSLQNLNKEYILVDAEFVQIGIYRNIIYNEENQMIKGIDISGKIFNALTNELLQDVQSIEVDKIYEAVVTGIKPYGVFVKIYGIHNGMIHITALNRHGLNCRDFKICQLIQVKVINIRPDKKLDVDIVSILN